MACSCKNSDVWNWEVVPLRSSRLAYLNLDGLVVSRSFSFSSSNYGISPTSHLKWTKSPIKHYESWAYILLYSLWPMHLWNVSKCLRLLCQGFLHATLHLRPQRFIQATPNSNTSKLSKSYCGRILIISHGIYSINIRFHMRAQTDFMMYPVWKKKIGCSHLQLGTLPICIAFASGYVLCRHLEVSKNCHEYSNNPKMFLKYV